MKSIITIISSIFLIGCAATTPRPETTKAVTPSNADSARTLIRRGMTGEARTLIQGELSHISAPTDVSRALQLLADSWEKEDNWREAASAWRNASERFPDSTSYRTSCWNVLARWAGQDTTLADSLIGVIRSEGDRFAAGQSLQDLYLAQFVAAILGDSSVVARGDTLIARYPKGQEAINLVGERFWDGLYPIWNDTEPRIKYLNEFIGKYPAFSWRDTAWRMKIGIYAGMGDTTSMQRETEGWLAASPGDPSVLYSAATFALDNGGGLDRARGWAEQAYKLREKLAKPSHLPDEEWLLYGPQIRAGIPTVLAEVRLREGKLEEAHQLALEALQLADYGVDEYGTPAPQQFLLGKIAAAQKNFDYAAQRWVEALESGDVVNRYAGLADSALKANFCLKSGAEVIAFSREKAKYEGIIFTRVTESAGLDTARGSRIAWGDYDNDGDDDLLVSGSRLYRNDKGFFKDVTGEAGLTADGCHGGVWGDYDNDGDLDLFCFSSSSDSTKAERLFRNLGNGRFEDVTARSGDIADSYSNEAAIWADLSGDGRLDLYIPGYERPAKGAGDLGNAWPSRMLIQDSLGVFHDRTLEFGLAPPQGRNLCGRSPVTCDFDRDGDLDLYVGNYRLQENLFWVNQGNPPSFPPFNRRGEGGLPPLLLQGESKGRAPQFLNLAPWYEIDGEEVDGWWGHTIGCQWGDFDSDGDFDLIAANLAHPRYIRFSNRTMLYRNNGANQPFSDVRRQWGIKYDECHSEPVWGDFDNDGDLDLYITCVYPSRRSYLYRNDGNRFTDITYLSGTRVFNGWGCATADYDNDGKLDLAACEGGKIELFRNDTKGGNWLEVAVVSTSGAKDNPIGSIVTVEASGKKQIRQVEGGKGAGSQSSPTLHFGVGSEAKPFVTIYSKGRKMIEHPYQGGAKVTFNGNQPDVLIRIR